MYPMPYEVGVGGQGDTHLNVPVGDNGGLTGVDEPPVLHHRDGGGLGEQNLFNVHARCGLRRGVSAGEEEEQHQNCPTNTSARVPSWKSTVPGLCCRPSSRVGS